MISLKWYHAFISLYWHLSRNYKYESNQSLGMGRTFITKGCITFFFKLEQFEPNFALSIIGWWEFQICLREDNYKIAKMHWKTLKIYFSRTTDPISTRLNTEHPWVLCLNEGPHNNAIAKHRDEIKKIFLNNQ